MKLPSFNTTIRELSLMQSKWASILDPVLSNPTTNPTLLTGIVLASGNNVINHKLGQLQQGWLITDINAAATIYRSAPFNDKTLTLNASAACTVNLMVY